MSQKTSEVKEEVKIRLTPQRFLTWVICGIILAITDQLASPGWYVSPISLNLILLIVLFILLGMGKGYYLLDLAAIYIAVGFMSSFARGIEPWKIGHMYFLGYVSPEHAEQFSKLLPSFLYVPKGIAELTKVGGQAVPWGVVATPLVYYILFSVSFYLMLFSYASLIAKRTVEVERLPFPYIIPTIQFARFLGESTPRKRAKLLDFTLLETKTFWTLFVIGLIIGIISAMFRFSRKPPMPYTHQWPLDLRPYLEKYLPGAYLRWWPFFSLGGVGIAYLTSIDVLVTVLVWFFVFRWFYPVILRVTGFAPTASGYPFRPIPNYDWPTIFPQELFALWSIPIALGLSPLILWWRDIVNSLRAAISGRGAEPGEIPPRTLWGILIISVIVFLALSASTGAGVAAILYWVLMSIFLVGNMLLVAEYFAFPHRFTGRFTKPIVYQTLNIPTGSSTAAGINWMMALTDNFYMQFSAVGYGMLAHYKLGRELGLTWKETFYLQIAAAVVGTIIAWIVGTIVAFTIGLRGPTAFDVAAKYTAPRATTWWAFAAPHVGVIRKVSPWSAWRISWLIGGVFLAWIIMWARARFPWFWLHPVGIFFSWHSWFMGCALIGLILKVLTLRIGGARAYERLGVPAVTGYIVGSGIGTVIIFIIETIAYRLYGAYYMFF